MDYSKSLIIGHQRNYMGLSLRRQVKKKLKGVVKNTKYADTFFHALGAKGFDILDISDYENANLLHDLNIPIPQEYKNGYSTVIDVGTVEHVFDAVQAVKNIRDLCQVGGHVIMMNPANSWLGHGFYQFSPEFFFRAFDHVNGFRVIKIFLIKKKIFGHAWYVLPDPLTEGRRGTIDTKKPCYIAVIAKKESDIELSNKPQAADYEQVWGTKNLSRFGRIYSELPHIPKLITEKILIKPLYMYRNRLLNRRIFFMWEKQNLVLKSIRRND